MEAVLILGEMAYDVRAQGLLMGIAHNTSAHPEIRAAALWSMQDYDSLLERMWPLLGDGDDEVAMHAIVSASRMVNSANCLSMIEQVGRDDRLSSGIVRALLESQKDDWLEVAIDYTIECGESNVRSWLLYLIGCLGRQTVAPILAKHGDKGKEIAEKVALFWNQFGSDWTCNPPLAEKIRYIRMQI